MLTYRKSRWIAVAAVGVFFLLCGAVLAFMNANEGPVVTMQKKMIDVENGSWGGDHILIEVAAAGVSIQFDCGDGRIDGPLKTDAKGNFSVKGFFTAQHAGPVRDEPVANPALYQGTVSRGVMTLEVTLPEQKTKVGQFTARHGDMGRVYRCH